MNAAKLFDPEMGDVPICTEFCEKLVKACDGAKTVDGDPFEPGMTCESSIPASSGKCYNSAFGLSANLLMIGSIIVAVITFIM